MIINFGDFFDIPFVREEIAIIPTVSENLGLSRDLFGLILQFLYRIQMPAYIW